MRRAIISSLALTLAACAESTIGLAPPGLDGAPARLFFPTGMALSADGARIYVANSNFDRGYSSGTLVSFPKTAFDEAAALAGRRATSLPASSQVAGLDGFAGELRRNPAGTALYVATRDNATLTRIALAADGRIDCPAEGGCSAGALRLVDQKMVDPYTITFGELVVPGALTPESVVMVGHLTPASAGTGASSEPARVAVVPERVATAGLPAFELGAYTVTVGTPATTTLAWDGVGRRLLAGGCQLRVSAEQVVSCGLDASSSYARRNIVRFLYPEAGTAAEVEAAELGPHLGGGDTVAMAVSSDGTLLYSATVRPNALVTTALPQAGQRIPTLVSTVPLAQAPARLLVLPGGAGQPDVVAVTARESDQLLLVDPSAGRVVASHTGFGDGPFELAAHPTPTGHRLYVGLFDSCGVAAFDVPAERPAQSTLVATVGACP